MRNCRGRRELARSLEGQVPETAGNRKAACNLEARITKAAVEAGEKKQETGEGQEVRREEAEAGEAAPQGQEDLHRC